MKRTKLKKEKKKPVNKLRILILEDNPADAELMEKQLLRENIDFAAQRAESRAGFSKALDEFHPDVILADYRLPKFDALRALELRKKKAPFTPFIIVTGTISEETAVECMKQGADDYLLKDRLARLGEAVMRALAERRLQAEIKSTEESLRNGERLLHTFIDSGSDMAFLKDDKFRHLMANRELCRFYKKEEKEIIGKTDAELMDKKAAAQCRRTDRQALTGTRVHVSEETVGVLTFETRKFAVKLSDNRIGVGGYIRDISEGKRVKEALLAAAARWRTTFDSMNDAVCLLDEKGAVRQCNRAMNRLLGIPYTKIIGKDGLSLFCGIRKKSSCPFHLLLKDGKPHKEETFWRQRWFQVTVDPILGDDGRVLGAVHIMTDITEAKKAKDALRESEERFRGLYENSHIGMYRTTPAGRILMANPALIRMLGYGSFAELAERNLQQEGFEPDYPRREFRRRVERVGHITGLEANWHKKDGTSIFVRESARIVKDADGVVVFYDGTVEDISERKRAEETVREMNEIFRLFLKHSPVYVFIKDENIRPVYLSENYEKMLKMPLAEILGKSMDELFPSTLSRSMVEDDKRLLREGEPREFIEELEGRTYSTLKFPIMIQGKAKYLAGYTMDISERHQIEAELKESENRYRKHFENSSEFYFTLDLKGNFVDVNKAAVSLTGYAKSELLKMNFMDYTPKRDHRKLFLAIAKVYKTGEPIQNFLVEAIMKDKSIKFFETNFTLLKDGERIIGVQGSSKDITERKHAEEQIRDSLREKEILLKEIHHRVKNNLQVISGLLTLQAQQVDDQRLQHIIKDSQNRIWTMALIHQTLYQSGNLADIDMADYIRSLAGNLLSSHTRVAMPPTVLFDLLPLRLSIDKAIPLALVLNELLTNVMKHAFADGRPGEIRIGLQECRDRSRPDLTDPGHAPADSTPAYELTVADNGVGLPEGFDLKSQKSLGLQLVAMLSKQLDAALAFESAGGTVVTITFHCHENS